MNGVEIVAGLCKREGATVPVFVLTSLALNGNLKSCIVLFLCFGIDIYIERDTIRKFIA